MSGPVSAPLSRDELLALDPEDFGRFCEITAACGSGPGGQHRNRTATAARAVLKGRELSATDCTERSFPRNRNNALRKLRMRLALAERTFPPVPPERFDCSVEHESYPLWAARILDYMETAEWDHKAAAILLQVTASALLKKLKRDPELWQAVNRKRASQGMPPLR